MAVTSLHGLKNGGNGGNGGGNRKKMTNKHSIQILYTLRTCMDQFFRFLVLHAGVLWVQDN